MSPIKGVSEIVRLPRLGKIRLGIKKENEGVSYPSPTDYFVCPDEVKKVFGEKPKELRIMFPTENSEQWASQYLRCYSASRGLICRGDGETALSRFSPKPGETIVPGSMEETICNPNACGYNKKGQCRRVMNLQFLLPDCPGFGVYQLDTTSFHSMKNINSALTFIRGVCQRVSMIPLSLQLVEQEVQPEGWCKTAHVLNLTCPHSLAEVQRFAQIPPGQALLLPPPDSEAPDDLFLNDSETMTPDEKERQRLDLWTRIKSKIWHFDIQNSQIGNWFEKNTALTVGLTDFEPPVPPSRFTLEILSLFCESIDRYAGH
ncbi:hypothetical protein [Dehalococcoides mccartyi]|uniref:Uncharacterized protein n=1 Tax=Dehalococcoides mccartyi (strain VS) TaxID=311424 RepID=D2BGD1_DEHMV|nr:hypothetical protein [Dehalococcoides mccartyi]ACZ61381.1 hypothetical protein DhcVS_219 [Dehalococcoides mccartyi VS]